MLVLRNDLLKILQKKKVSVERLISVMPNLFFPDLHENNQTNAFAFQLVIT
jgi:hypothetical protein